MKKNVQPYQRVSQPLHEMLTNNFLGGIAWALGLTVGLSLLIALLTILANFVNFVPIVGDFVAAVLDYVLANNPQVR